MDRTEDSSQGRKTFDQDLAKALAHPLRVRILEALQGRTASPKELEVELAEELQINLGNIVYHCGVLMTVGCIEEVGTRPVRGAIEHFYTARPRSLMGHQDWRRAPLSVRAGVTGEALRTFLERVGAAIDADTIDRREDTTLNWMTITVDDQGWREAAALLGRTAELLVAIHERSSERLGDSDGIPVVTGLAAFEAAPGGAVAAEGVEGGPPAEPSEDTG